jgi:hypothetical protein
MKYSLEALLAACLGTKTKRTEVFVGRVSFLAILAVPLVALLATPVSQKHSALAPAYAHISGQGTVADIDADATSALDKMGRYLRSLKAFQVRAVTNRDDVLDDGQHIEFDSVSDILAQRPNRLRVETTSDRQQRLYLYNGTEVTVWAERLNYYATVPAPASISELVDRLHEKYAIELPLTDLFTWGTDKAKVKEIKSAIDLGPSVVDGTTCQQFAFRQVGIDWQIWIQNGDYPLPRKLVITTLTDEARPEYRATLTWNVAPSFNDGAFTFDPLKDAQKIVLAEVGNSPGGANQ